MPKIPRDWGLERVKRASKYTTVTRQPVETRSGEVKFTRDQIPSVTGGKSPAMDFSAALMRGDPTALEALKKIDEGHDGLVKPSVFRALDAIEAVHGKEKPALADMFIAETYSMPKRLGLNAHQSKKIEPILASYRNDIHKAHRFALDKDFVRYVTQLSSTTRPEKLLARLQYATLPYDIVWIEFDLRTKVEVMRSVHGLDPTNFNWNEVADRLGLIIKRLSNTEAIVEMVCETFGENGLIGTTICYFYSVREYSFSTDDGRGTGCRPFLLDDRITQKIFERRRIDEETRDYLVDQGNQLHTIGAASLWGYTEKNYGSVMIEKLSQMKSLALPEYLMRHGVLGTGRMKSILELLIPDAGQEAVNDTVANLMVQETTEFTGMMRWIVCVLCCLNEVPVSMQRVEQEGTIRVGLTNRRKLLDYHRVTLRVPKTNPVRYIERKLQTGAKRRAHEVRAHWRTYLPEQYCRYDEHQWIYDHDDGYRLCEKCEAFGRLIHEHIRGDPNLGWVQKSYIVKPTKQGLPPSKDPNADKT